MRGHWFAASCRWLVVVVSLALYGCSGYTTTTRIVNGHTLEGRPIEPEGYALYLTAQLSEQQGALHRARKLYLDAARLDPQSPELWTRVGALGCRLKLAHADTEIERALNLDRWYAPAWVARARCELFRGKLDLALRYARAAQVADPDDFETTLVLVDVYQAKGKRGLAVTQLQAFLLRQPGSRQAQTQLQHLSEQKPPTPPDPTPQNADPTMTEAILAGELTRASARATELRMHQSEVARLALSLNRPVLANQHMALVLNAAPHDSALRALALLSAHRAHDQATFQRLLALPPWFTSCDSACASYLDQVLGDYLH